MTICLMGSELFCVDGRTYRRSHKHDEPNRCFPKFCEYA